MNLGLGVDTGGTYTDSVIWDFDSNRLLHKAKALTTRYDLTVGIANSIESLGEIQTENIKLVSVSTTLATNAAVEGHGGRVCLLAVGYDYRLLKNFGLTDASHISSVNVIRGGHDVMGEELNPLDLEKAKQIVEETKDTVDAYAVSAYGGVRNPSHEIQLRELIMNMTEHPVVCGHQLTTQLDSIKRAETATLNARLIPLISDLIKAIKQVLLDRDISAPLMIVKGDGHIMNTEVTTEKPVETLLSGPAASIVGGCYLSGIDNGVVIDMGGTTTDIAILRSGEPKIAKKGASVGGWRTFVRAADISTTGLGGDSHILLNESNIKIDPKRVIPLSVAATFYSQVLDELKTIQTLNRTSNLVPPCDCLVKLRSPNGIPLNSKERDVVNALSDGPKSLIKLAGKVNVPHPSLLNTDSLEEMGLVGRIGLTPTDILHTKGVYTQWNVEAAERGAQIYASHLGKPVDTLIESILSAVNKKLAVELISKFVSDETSYQSVLGCDVCSLLIDKALEEDKSNKDISINMNVNMPLIAIGAPVKAYFPKVASMLNTKLVIPEHAEVANAVGAVTGTIVETVEVTLTPVYEISGTAYYTVHSPMEKRDFDELKDAVVYSKQIAEKLAVEKAKRSGADRVELHLDTTDSKGVVAKDRGGDEVFLGSNVKATAVGKFTNW